MLLESVSKWQTNQTIVVLQNVAIGSFLKHLEVIHGNFQLFTKWGAICFFVFFFNVKYIYLKISPIYYFYILFYINNYFITVRHYIYK